MKYFCILALLLSSCGVNHHLKRSKYHLNKAVALGAKTVFKEIPVKVLIPGDSAEFDFGAVIDFESFRYVSDLNDSLVREIQSLKSELEPNRPHAHERDNPNPRITYPRFITVD